MPGESPVWVGRPGLIGLLTHAPVSAQGAVAGLTVLLWSVILRAWTKAGMSVLFSTPAGRLVVAEVLILVLVLSAIASFVWASWVSNRSVYAITNQRILSVAPSSLGGTNWISRRELKRMAVKRFGVLVFERDIVAADEVLLTEPTNNLYQPYVPREIQNCIVFSGLRDPQGVAALVDKTFGIALSGTSQ